MEMKRSHHKWSGKGDQLEIVQKKKMKFDHANKWYVH